MTLVESTPALKDLNYHDYGALDPCERISVVLSPDGPDCAGLPRASGSGAMSRPSGQVIVPASGSAVTRAK
jgi:hypothetical protein